MSPVHTSLGLATLTLLLATDAASAQRADAPVAAAEQGGGALACASTLGPRVRAPADSATRRPSRAPAPARTSIDTTITLAITDRTWQRDDYDGGIALGTGAPAAGQSRWSACAGVAVHLGHVAATLHNVRGVIHLRADPTAMRRLGATSPDSLLQRSSSTPPSAPPRR